MKSLVKICTILLTAASSCILSVSAFAEINITTVSELLSSPKDEMEVKLRGKIIGQQEGEEEYIFTDNGKDKVILDIDDKKDFQYDPNKTVEVYGVVNIKSDEEDKKEEAQVDPTPEKLEIEIEEIKVISEGN